MKFVIGIDPGKTGGFCLMSEVGFIYSQTPVPTLGKKKEVDCQAIASWLRSAIKKANNDPKNIIVVLEKVGAMPGNGVSSMFKFGRNAGILEGLVAGLGIPYQLVHPKTWAKVCKDAPGESPKDRSLVTAKRLFPHCTFLATERSRKPHEGLIDATLMAEYGRRNLI